MLSVGDWHTLFSIPRLWHRTNQQCGWSAIQASSWLSMWAPKKFGVSFLQPVRWVRSCAKVRLSQAVCRLDSLEKRISCSSTNGRTWPFVCKPTWLHSVPSDGATRNALLGSSLKEIQDLGWPLRIRLLHNCTCRSPPRHPAKQRSENNRGTNDGRGSQSITKCSMHSMRYVLMDLVSVLESKDTTHGFWLWSATTRTTNCCKTLHHIATILHLVAPLYLLRILVCKIFVETMTEQNYLGKDLVLSVLSALSAL